MGSKTSAQVTIAMNMVSNLNSYMGEINIDTIRYRYSSKNINYLIEE